MEKRKTLLRTVSFFCLAFTILFFAACSANDADIADISYEFTRYMPTDNQSFFSYEGNITPFSRTTTSYQKATAAPTKAVEFPHGEVNLSYEKTLEVPHRSYEQDVYSWMENNEILSAKFHGETGALMALSRFAVGEKSFATEHPEFSSLQDYRAYADELIARYTDVDTSDFVFSVETSQDYRSKDSGSSFYEQSYAGFFSEAQKNEAYESYVPENAVLVNCYRLRYTKQIGGLDTEEYIQVTLREDGVLYGFSVSMPNHEKMPENIQFSKEELETIACEMVQSVYERETWQLDNLRAVKFLLITDEENEPLIAVSVQGEQINQESNLKMGLLETLFFSPKTA